MKVNPWLCSGYPQEYLPAQFQWLRRVFVSVSSEKKANVSHSRSIYSDQLHRELYISNGAKHWGHSSGHGAWEHEIWPRAPSMLPLNWHWGWGPHHRPQATVKDFYSLCMRFWVEGNWWDLWALERFLGLGGPVKYFFTDLLSEPSHSRAPAEFSPSLPTSTTDYFWPRSFSAKQGQVHSISLSSCDWWTPQKSRCFKESLLIGTMKTDGKF